IGDVCSNVGIATLVRVQPELADHEHLYFERLHAGGDRSFDAAYRRAYRQYFGMLNKPETEPAPAAEPPAPAAEPTAEKDAAPLPQDPPEPPQPAPAD
ncbi:MAG: hypothetical protein II412_05015, partial [Clostridia bacterium]|nr:hypothetical protein [Clostridia bacterium]